MKVVFFSKTKGPRRGRVIVSTRPSDLLGRSGNTKETPILEDLVKEECNSDCQLRSRSEGRQRKIGRAPGVGGVGGGGGGGKVGGGQQREREMGVIIGRGSIDRAKLT